MNEIRKFTFWAVYDLEQGLIKMNPDDDCLALFETEKGAAAAVRATPGSAYKELVLYSHPQPTPKVALLEAFDAGRRAAADELAAALESMIQAADRARWDGYFPAATITRAVEVLTKYQKQGDLI